MKWRELFFDFVACIAFVPIFYLVFLYLTY